MRWLLTAFLVSGCYLSHGRAPDTGEDGGPDPGTEAGAVDAGPFTCDELAIGQASLDEGVTPRLVALDRGAVGVIYVRTDGDPTRVVYERLGPALDRITGPVTVTTGSFTWAEPARTDGSIAIAYGVAGDRESILREITFDGAEIGRARRVALYHPALLRATESGALFWLAFAMRSDNSLELAHVTRDGVFLHPPIEIALGRYGAGHGAAPHPTRRAHVIGYPREGPPGVRNGYVNVVTEDGALGPERLLGDDGDRGVTPVVAGGALTVVRHGGDELILERLDPDTLETIARVERPGVAHNPLVSTLGEHVVIAHVADGALVVEELDAELATTRTITAPLPGTRGASTGSVVTDDGAIVFALHLASGTTTFPHLVRVECRR